MVLIRTKEDYKTALRLLVNSFDGYDSMEFIAQKKNKRAMTILCDYCLKISMLQESAYIANDRHSVLLLYDHRKKIPFFESLTLKSRLIFRCIGILNVRPVLSYMHLKDKERDKRDALYVWMLAAEPVRDKLSSVSDLKDDLFRLSEELGLPILVEATALKNVAIYRRYGFEIYHKEEPIKERNFPIWFLRRNTNQVSTL